MNTKRIGFISTGLIMAIFLFAYDTAFAEDLNVPTKTAIDKGIKRCFKMIKETSDFLIKDHSHSTSDTWNTKNPNERLFNSVILQKFSDGATITSLTGTPTKADTCDAVYTSVFYNQTSCTATREDFKNLKYVGEKQGVIYLNNDTGLDVYLTQADSGCVVVKQEVLYGIKD